MIECNKGRKTHQTRIGCGVAINPEPLLVKLGQLGAPVTELEESGPR